MGSSPCVECLSVLCRIAWYEPGDTIPAVLRKGFNFRGRAAAQALNASTEAGADAIALPPLDQIAPAPSMEDGDPSGGPRLARPRITKKRIALVVLLGLLVGMATAYTQKDQLSPKVANFSRTVIGDENTARVESWWFTVQDRIDKVKYKLLGGETNPFCYRGAR